MVIGLLVNRETQSLLIGESATAEVVGAIRDAIAGTNGVTEGGGRTIHVGPDGLLVGTARIVVDPTWMPPVSHSPSSRRRTGTGDTAPFRTEGLSPNRDHQQRKTKALADLTRRRSRHISRPVQPRF